MKLQRVLSVGSLSDGLRGAKTTRGLTPNQRISLLENLRRQAAKIYHYEYPRRLRRVLEVTEQKKG